MIPTVTAIQPACGGLGHSRWSHIHNPCTCSPEDRERFKVQRRVAARRTGRAQVSVQYGADVDPVAVERLIAGKTPSRITRAEREAAVAILTAQGMSALNIAVLLKVNARTVVRYRRRLVAEPSRESRSAA